MKRGSPGSLRATEWGILLEMVRDQAALVQRKETFCWKRIGYAKGPNQQETFCQIDVWSTLNQNGTVKLALAPPPLAVILSVQVPSPSPPSTPASHSPPQIQASSSSNHPLPQPLRVPALRTHPPPSPNFIVAALICLNALCPRPRHLLS